MAGSPPFSSSGQMTTPMAVAQAKHQIAEQVEGIASVVI
jgi:hypothetical protein